MKNIIFFDGVCNLCNQFVDFILTTKKSEKIYIASLQGLTAQKYLSAKDLKQLKSIIYLKNDQLYKQSNAILEIAADLGYPYKLMVLFKIIPSPLRDVIYNFISKNRYRVFGKKNTCRIPTEKEKKQFLP